MKLEKAIEIVSDSANAGMTTFNDEYKQAQRLLISAGKVIQWGRGNPLYVIPRLLPGETKE